MSEEKTEEPSPKKLREARRRGQIPRSRELGTAATLLSVAAILGILGPELLDAFRGLLLASIAAAGAPSPRPEAMLVAGASVGMGALLPVLLTAMLAGGLASFLQIGPLFTLEPLAAKPERLDPIQGLKNLFTQRQLIELLKTILKILLVGSVAYAALASGLRGIVGLAARDAEAAIGAGGSLVRGLFLEVGGVMVGIAVLDVLYQRWRHRQDHRMSREELKREHKDAEGDPHAKQERDRLRRELVEHDTIERVQSADVLIVNPTHLAVALSYDQDGDAAPEVVAKGRDHLARRMIEIARQAGVPIMRDIPLARALIELEIGDEIPEPLYEVVAAVLRAAWSEREQEQER
ncbi:MAG: EscU/YscU/HrcU family type III secretion system export apparatus switch protein [Myxococcales bacterium]|nr:EscU/YscU/HrcU family type III secretion system export apparatus switch protein [Myxococcales bacterium]